MSDPATPDANDPIMPAVVVPRRREDERGPRRPPVPPDANLRHFPKVPILAQRLFDSKFNSIATDPEWRAGVTLWLKSWFQEPAGSLPNDDGELVKLSGYGENMEGWLRVKAMALHGWFLGTDGRMYHKVVAEVVNEALDLSRKQSKKAKSGWEKRRAREAAENKGKPTKAKKKRKPAAASKAVDAAAMPRIELNGMDKNRSTDTSTVLGSSHAVSASAPETSEPESADAPIFMRYPCVIEEGGDMVAAFYDITQAKLEQWQQTYPKVDVPQALRELWQWAEDSPAKRKTPGYAPHHIAKCLETRQRKRELDAYREPSTAPSASTKPDYAAGTANNRRSFLDVDD